MPGSPDGILDAGEAMFIPEGASLMLQIHYVTTGKVERDRMSVPYFFQPSYGALIETIPTTVTDDRPSRYEPVISGKWITAKSMLMLEDQA